MYKTNEIKVGTMNANVWFERLSLSRCANIHFANFNLFSSRIWTVDDSISCIYFSFSRKLFFSPVVRTKIVPLLSLNTFVLTDSFNMSPTDNLSFYLCVSFILMSRFFFSSSLKSNTRPIHNEAQLNITKHLIFMPTENLLSTSAFFF